MSETLKHRVEEQVEQALPCHGRMLAHDFCGVDGLHAEDCPTHYLDAVVSLIEQVVKEEREACELAAFRTKRVGKSPDWNAACEAAAAAIRQRKDQQ